MDNALTSLAFTFKILWWIRHGYGAVICAWNLFRDSCIKWTNLDVDGHLLTRISFCSEYWISSHLFLFFSIFFPTIKFLVPFKTSDLKKFSLLVNHAWFMAKSTVCAFGKVIVIHLYERVFFEWIRKFHSRINLWK